jgi:hypothetical protein
MKDQALIIDQLEIRRVSESDLVSARQTGSWGTVESLQPSERRPFRDRLLLDNIAEEAKKASAYLEGISSKGP